MKRLSRLFVVATIVAASSAGADLARADPVALTMGNISGNHLYNGPFTLGWKFSVNSTINVTGLGVFDSGLDGLVQSHDVGVFDSAGFLLASATVASGTADPLVHQFRYAPASVLLTPGQDYVIGAVWNSYSDEILFGFDSDPTTVFATAPSVNYLVNAYVNGGTLQAPLQFYATPTQGYFGPNFIFASVPEIDPAGMGSVLALVTGALGVLERRRLKAA